MMDSVMLHAMSRVVSIKTAILLSLSWRTENGWRNETKPTDRRTLYAREVEVLRVCSVSVQSVSPRTTSLGGDGVLSRWRRRKRAIR